MTTTGTQIETAHDDMIHDAQLDYYGKRLATCSSDRTVRVFDVVDGQQSRTPKQILKGHTGPVWQVAWAHPKFGHILASCSYDGKVLIWKEEAQNQNPSWTKIKEHALHSASVNSVSWAPHELGAIVACASSDGKISVLTFKMDNSSQVDIFTAHALGANAVSWAPATLPGSLIAPVNPPPSAAVPTQPNPANTPQKRFASAGSDNTIKIWAYNDASASWTCETTLDAHTDWVRDVAWAPNIGLPRSYLASCSQDRTVLIWTKDGPNGPWQKTQIDGGASDKKFPDAVWRVSWSLSGNILAVSCGDGKVTLWKEVVSTSTTGGKPTEMWECVSEMTS